MKYLKIPLYEEERTTPYEACLVGVYSEPGEHAYVVGGGKTDGFILEEVMNQLREHFVVDDEAYVPGPFEITAETTLGQLMSKVLEDVEAPPDDEAGYTVEELQQALDIVAERRAEGKGQEPFLPINAVFAAEEEGS